MAAARPSFRDGSQDHCQAIRMQCCGVKSRCMLQGGFNSGDYIPVWVGARFNSPGAVESATEGSSSDIRFLALCLRFFSRSVARHFHLLIRSLLCLCAPSITALSEAFQRSTEAFSSTLLGS